MWWFLLLVPFADAAFVPTSSLHLTTEANAYGTISEKDVKFLEEQYDKITADYLEAFSAAHTPRIRQKRELGLSSNYSILSDNSGVFRLQSVQPLFAVCSPTVAMKFIDVGNWTYTVCVASRLYRTATVYVGYLTNAGWHELASWEVMDPEDVALLYDNQILYVLVADSRNGEGIPLVKFDLRYQRKDVDHTVHSAYTTAVAIWKMKIDGRFHMAVANSAGNKDADDLSTEIYVYHWMGTYFDMYSSMLAFDVKDIEPFHIHGAAYIAVANYRASKDNFLVDSEIFRYNLDQGKWLSYQKIRTYGAMDWEFFSLGEGTNEEFFLAVANKYDARGGITTEKKFTSVIYKFEKDIFVPFQCLETSSATSVAAFTDGLKFLLAVGTQDDGVFLFQYDGWRFERASIQYTQRAMSSGVVSLAFHEVQQMNSSLILAVSNKEPRFVGEATTFRIGFAYENPLKEWHDTSLEWCVQSISDLDHPSAAAPLQEVKNLFFVDQKDPIVIEGNLYFDAGLETSKLSTPKLVESNSGQVYDSRVIEKLLELQSRLDKVKSRLSAINDVLSNAVTLQGDQHITGSLDFRDVQFTCETSNCHFGNITTVYLNGEDVSNLKENLVFLDEDKVINAQISVENLEVQDVHVSGLVDGIDVNNLVTKSGNHTITATKTFTNLMETNDLEVHGLVDGIKISADTVLLRTGYQNVTGQIVFNDVETKWLEINGMLNGRDFNDFIRDIVLTQGYFEITGTKTFKDIVVQDLQMAQGAKMNGVDLLDLWVHTMWKDRDQTVAAPMILSSMIVENHLWVDGPINGLHIPSQAILLVHEDATIPFHQTFQENVFVNQLYVTNSINGIKVNPETGELDILMKTGEQFITGHKSFNTIYLDDHSFVGGTVDGVDLSALYEAALRKDAPLNSTGTWTFNNLIVRGPITVGGKISGLDLADLYNRAVKLNETVLPAFDSFVFEDIVTIDALDSDDINGIDVTRDLVLVNEPQVITGEKTFHDIKLEENVIVLERVNNIDMSFLNDTLLRLGNQIITANKTIVGNLKVKYLTVHGRINGVNFSDVVTVNSNSNITGTKTFRNATFENLVVDNLQVNGLVNGVNVLEMMKDTLTYDGEQTVTGIKTVRGALRVPKGSNLQTNSINGVDLSALLADAVLIDEKQTIRGRKHFASAVAFSDLTVKGSIDGVSEWDMKHNWLLQDEDQVIEAETVFEQSVSAGDIRVNGYINGINITHLADTIVKTTQPTVIKGHVIFQEVVSHGDVTLTGKIQGIDLSEEVVDMTKENVLTAGKTFMGDVVVDNLTVKGLIDGVSIEDLCGTAILLDRPQTLLSMDVMGNVTIETGATVNGTVSGVDLESLYKESVKSADPETSVNGLKHFDQLTVEGTLNVLGKFGGVDINDLANNYMSLTRDQVIEYPMEFEELQINGTLAAGSFYTADQKINDISIPELNETVLRTTGKQTVDAVYTFKNVVFEDDVIVGGEVNGLEVPKGLMQRDKENRIFSPKIFKQSVQVLGDLYMDPGKTIQGVDLSEWYKNAVKKDFGTYEVGGSKTFSGFTATDMTVNGLVDGVRISEDSLLLTYGDQVITGSKAIYGDVTIHGKLTVTGYVNGTDLEDLAERAVRKDRNNTITGMKTFTKPLRVNNLEAPSINSVDIQELYNKVNADLDLDPLNKKIEVLGDVISEIQDAYDNQAVLFQYYDVFQTFEVLSGYSWLHVPVQNKEFLLLSDFTVLSSGCTSIRVYEFNPSTGIFDLNRQGLISSSAIAMKTMKAWGHVLVIIANREPNQNCSNTPVEWDETGDTPCNIYLYDAETTTFLPYETIKTHQVVDIATFIDDSMACIVFLEVENTLVACTPDRLHEFDWREQLRTAGGRKVTVSQNNGDIILAIASVDVPNRSYQQCVDIYRWNRHTKSFGEPVQIIQSIHATSVSLIPVDRGSFYELFLAISEGVIPRVKNSPRLFIYKFNGNSFDKYQEIKDHGELEYVILPSGELVLFVLDTKRGQIKLYQHKGVSGFEKIDKISSSGTLTMHVFKRKDPEDEMNHYLALAGLQSTFPNVWDDPESAKILKSKMKGKRLPKLLN